MIRGPPICTQSRSSAASDVYKRQAVVLDGEHLAGAPEAALHLVGDEQHALLVEDLLDALEVVVGRRDDAALAHHRLGDEGADVAREVQADDPVSYTHLTLPTIY